MFSHIKSSGRSTSNVWFGRVPQWARALCLAAVVLCIAACARVPKESVELSVTVGRDLAEVHRANRALALKYFDRMRQDVDRFVNEVYRPYIIRQTVGPVVKDIQDAAASPNGALDPVDIMEVYSEEVLAKVDSFHQAMQQPIEEQEGQVVGSIDDAFQSLQNANAIVTGHLASVRKVQDAQAEFLGRFGQEDLPDRLGGAVTALSDSLTSILEQGRRVQGMLDKGPTELNAARETLNTVLEEMRKLSPAADITRTSDGTRKTDTVPRTNVKAENPSRRPDE